MLLPVDMSLLSVMLMLLNFPDVNSIFDVEHNIGYNMYQVLPESKSFGKEYTTLQ